MSPSDLASLTLCVLFLKLNNKNEDGETYNDDDDDDDDDDNNNNDNNKLQFNSDYWRAVFTAQLFIIKSAQRHK